MKYMLLLTVVLLSLNAEAQVRQQQGQNNSYQQQNSQQMQNNPVVKMSRSFISNSGDQRKAYNLLVLQEVATYKLGDETLQKEIDAMKNNQEYYRKLERIKKRLSNSKLSDSRNKEVMRILNDAGNRISNLLDN